ncbi:MAG: hypothetical protein A2932_01645 [Candidatus Spechtbacteria bacterium RIFCSPLOWO2_01_FULL_46_10]|uniref:Elongation factor P n=1 Tax=Candidatus Spechtbacteria bacterium RIFCSPLOWO2_01_FULL_46_10 TaxID=1802163 RepID=A0A1G2HG85_9BACT|nr:MAG: hypothetical protein A2932_01645 [Candidatus Spechtbacteria bacterium RIFCSPLOWO2_01_FULL_46_10]
MILASDLRKDGIFILDGTPHKVLEAHHQKMARQGAVVQTKLRNLLNGATISRNFNGNERFEEAEIEKRKLLFLYKHRGEYGFANPGNRAERFILEESQLGNEKHFLKPNLEVDVEFFGGEIVNIIPPIKGDYKVVEAPPNVKGDTASGGNKAVTIETGAKILTPLFIEEGDVIRVNTEKGEYVERVKKGN